MFENLENRCLFTYVGVPVIPYGVSLANGVLRIKGAEGSDSAEVIMHDGQVRVLFDDDQLIETDWGDIPVYYPPQDFDPAVVKKIVFYGNDGNDSFINKTSIPSAAYGGYGDDELTGGYGPDALYGGPDDDDLYGRAGSDSIWGNSGGDLLVGGSGSDFLYAKDGTRGNDLVFGDNVDGTGKTGASDYATIDFMQSRDPSLINDYYNGIETLVS
jgi:hypothetical protein